MKSPAAKLVAFGVALAVVFAVAFGAAKFIAPDALSHRETGGGHAMHKEAPNGEALPGLAAEQAGYRLVADTTTLQSVPASLFRFRVTGPDGGPVSSYRSLHERELHLIVVRRDLAGFQHVHPVRGDDGAWSTPLDLSIGGVWRAFADFSPAAGPDQLTLGVDLQADGAVLPAPVPGSARAAPSGLAVKFERSGSDVAVTVLRDGQPVTPEHYLGARGHLVALRQSDLAYLHVHPVEGAATATGHGPNHGAPSTQLSEHGVGFKVSAPTAGIYALYFDYQLDGTVHTASTMLDLAP